MSFHRLRLLCLLLATPLATLAMACSTDVRSNECSAALARCGDDLDFATFCKAQPTSCTVEGQSFLAPSDSGGLLLPANQTVTVDLSRAGVDARVVDLAFFQADDFSDPSGSFQFEMDGISAEAADPPPADYVFPGHMGPPKEFKATWHGTVRPEVRVQMRLTNAACWRATLDSEACYDPTGCF
jgi:hypothetical protein